MDKQKITKPNNPKVNVIPTITSCYSLLAELSKDISKIKSVINDKQKNNINDKRLD